MLTLTTSAKALLVGALVAIALVGCSTVRSQTEHPTITYLDQGWNSSERQSFYYTTQGTVILPAIWFGALDGKDGRRLMSAERMERLGFLMDDQDTPGNPHHWPIGFATDTRSSIATVGVTCAACHTSQITYHGTVMRVDGGQSNVNLDAFKKAVVDAILSTGADPNERAAFEKRAIALGYPRDRIDADFTASYQTARAGIPARAQIASNMTLAGPGRNDALAAIAYVLFNYSIGVPSNTNKANAPVNFPQLWDIPHLYWVQYNGAVHQPMARNIGEAIGTGAVTHFIDPKTGKLAALPARWRTSIPVRNLYALETIIASLKPPAWPQSVFGPIDQARADRGHQLFLQNCSACHGVRSIANSQGDAWSVKVISLQKIGTDPMQANNFAHTYYDGTKLGLSNHVSAAQGLLLVTGAIRKQAYQDEHVPASEWPAYDGNGRKSLVTTPCGYKARPLVGVWATPPFLHNGSVPTIFDLLSEKRPARFHTGAIEYDPVHLGFVDATGPEAVTIDTSLVGNSNAGHWFTNDARPGRIGPRLGDEEKYDIIEYLKIATYANYPSITVSSPDPEPCAVASY